MIAVHRQRLENRQRHVAGSRRHIHKQEIHILPDHVLPELLDRTGNDGTTPDNGGFLVLQKQVDAHDVNADTALDGQDAVLGAAGGAAHAEQLGNGRAGDVGVQNTDLVAQTAHRDGQHGAGHAFAHAALAGYHADHLFDVAFGWGGSCLRGAAFAVGAAVAAVVVQASLMVNKLL